MRKKLSYKAMEKESYLCYDFESSRMQKKHPASLQSDSSPKQ